MGDLETALAFYEDVLGMTRKVGPFHIEGSEIGQLYGLSGYPGASISGAWMYPGGGDDSTLVELIEWHRPQSGGAAYPVRLESGGSFANHIGIPRTAFNVTGCQEIYEALVSRGVSFVSPPLTTNIGPEVMYCCFENYDGTILQLYEYVSGGDEQDYARFFDAFTPPTPGVERL